MRRQVIVSRATMLVSSNFRMLVFTISKQVFWNLGRQAIVSRVTLLSPQISECLFLQFRNKYSEIWGDKLLAPMRHCCLLKFQNVCIQKLERRLPVSREINIVSLNYRMFSWRWNSKQQKHNLLLSGTDYTSLHQQRIQFCYKDQTTNIWHKLPSTYNTTHILTNQHLNNQLINTRYQNIYNNNIKYINFQFGQHKIQ